MDRDRLFVQSLDELTRLVEAPDEYSALRIAAILRQLLLDARRLVDEVNRNRRTSIRFTINDNSNYTNLVMSMRPTFYSVEDGLDPDTALTAKKPITLTRDQFLSHRVMVINGVDVTIKELIEQLAHIEGGVHVGEPRTDKEQTLRDTAQTLGIGGLPAGTRMMRAIGRVVAKSLRPLRDAIQQGGTEPSSTL